MASALANRYARALLDVATKPGAEVGPGKVTFDLEAFREAYESSNELKGVLVSPAVPPDKKKAIIGRIADKLELSRITRNFIYVVTDHRRLGLLGEIVAAFQNLLDERMGVLRGGVTAAHAVEQDQQDALAARLSEATGRQVTLEYAVDPKLLGGLVTRIGSTVYDGSVRGRLRAIERKLASE